MLGQLSWRVHQGPGVPSYSGENPLCLFVGGRQMCPHLKQWLTELAAVLVMAVGVLMRAMWMGLRFPGIFRAWSREIIPWNSVGPTRLCTLLQFLLGFRRRQRRRRKKRKTTEEIRGKEGVIPPGACSDLAKQGSVTSLLPATYMCYMLRLAECPWPRQQDVRLYMHGHVCLGLYSLSGTKAIPAEEVWIWIVKKSLSLRLSPSHLTSDPTSLGWDTGAEFWALG